MNDDTIGQVPAQGHARHDDPDTSHRAARELVDKTTMMRRLLQAFSVMAMTSEEASDACGYDAADGAWKRVSDLTVLGYIEDTGERRVAHSGRRQMVRAITDLGLAVLRGEKVMIEVAPAERDPNEHKVATLRRLADQAESRGMEALPLDLLWKVLNYREKEH